MTCIQVTGVGAAVPHHVLTNADLTQLVDTSDEWIVSRTGIRERRIVSGDESVASLGYEAAVEALACANLPPDAIDLILVASSTPDTIYPMASAQIQGMLGIQRVAGFDMTVACTGFSVALITAHRFLQSGMYRRALVIGSDTHSRVTNWTDRNTCVLFGDGAGAFVLSRLEGENGPDCLLAAEMSLDGSKGAWLTLKTGFENAPMVNPVLPAGRYVTMQGRDIFKFTVSTVPQSIIKTVADAKLTLDDIDFIVLHQANARIIQAIAEKLNVPANRFLVDMAYYGNTSAASIPIAVHNAVVDGVLKPGQRLVLCGFGAGLSWATSVLDWNCADHRSHPTRAGQTPRSQACNLLTSASL